MKGFTVHLVRLVVEGQGRVKQGLPEWTRSCAAWRVWATPSEVLFSDMM
jgi:hypothetical protein